MFHLVFHFIHLKIHVLYFSPRKQRGTSDSDDEPDSSIRPAASSGAQVSSGYKHFFQMMPKSVELDDEIELESPKRVRRNLFPSSQHQSEFSDISSYKSTSCDESSSLSNNSEYAPFEDYEHQESSDGVVSPSPPPPPIRHYDLEASYSGAILPSPGDLFIDDEPSDHDDPHDEQPHTTPNPASASAAHSKHPMLPSCQCKKECSRLINEARRKELHEQLWAMTYNERKQFMALHVERSTPKRPRVAAERLQRRRKISRRYFLPNEKGMRTEICRIFFLATFGFTSDSAIRQIFVTTPRDSAIVQGDKRGRSSPANKFSTNVYDTIKAHINSYHPCISHYRRKHAPNRKYLPPDVTIKAMHTDFNDKHQKVSYATYRKIVARMNISFAKTGGEACEQCDDFKQNHKPIHASFQDDCEICQNQQDHDQNAIQARTKYRQHAEHGENDTTYLSADMQKVQLIPRMPQVKTSFFTSRLLVFHETFAPLGELRSELDHDKRVFACVWHEASSGRSAPDVTSAFAAAINNHDSKPHLKIWLDNCTSQNKNWYLFTSLVRIVNSLTMYPETIELLFLEKGHTFMSADSFHGHVEKYILKKANTRPLCDFEDFKSALECCGVAPKVHQLKAGEIRQWDSGVSKGKNVPKIQLAKVKAALFERGNTQGMRVKLSHSEDNYTDYPFLKRNTVEEIENKKLPSPIEKERGIASTKKQKIVDNLVKHMPSERQKLFWKNLPVDDNAVDLENTNDEHVL